MSPKKLEQWEKRLRQVLDRIDSHLEDTYGGMYPLRSNRPDRGATSNVKYDGLFAVEAKYSAGFGSRHGEGYTLDIRLATMSNVPEEIRKAIEEDVVKVLERELPVAFPDVELGVVRDGNVYKIRGDLGLARGTSVSTRRQAKS